MTVGVQIILPADYFNLLDKSINEQPNTAGEDIEDRMLDVFFLTVVDTSLSVKIKRDESINDCEPIKLLLNKDENFDCCGYNSSITCDANKRVIEM